MINLKMLLLALLISCTIAQLMKNQVGNDTVDSRIVNGVATSISKLPFQAIVFPGPYLCGGSILSTRWIASAAHCTFGYQPNEVRVVVGVTKISELKEFLDVSFITNHDHYIASTKEYDISMLKLRSNLYFSPSVQPVKLVSYEPRRFDLVKVSGFGKLSEGGPTSDNLMSVDIEIMDVYQTNYRSSDIRETMILAGRSFGIYDSCQGDSGGPLVNRYNELVGIVSWGNGCAHAGYPGVYTNVYKLRGWINDIMIRYDFY